MVVDPGSVVLVEGVSAMLRALLLATSILAAQGPAPSPVEGDEPAPKAGAEGVEEARALADYNALRDKTPETAAAQWKLATWCERNGLKPEAYVHFGRVIELDPRRDAAWQKLGFKRHDGRWMTAEQVAADDERKKAEKTWLAQLKKWHKTIHGGPKQAETRAALEAVTDPSAVSSVYREFGGGGARDQEIAVGLLGQIESPTASQALAMLAVYGKSPVVRRLATETLRGRKPEDYLDLLVGLMKDFLRYEVKPVGGPGSPGGLFVEGERFNVQRFYAPPAAPTYTPRPGDAITYDGNGFPVVSRTQATTTRGNLVGVPGSKTLATERDTTTLTTITYSFGNAIMEARKGALVAQAQLAADVARIDAINENQRQFNELVMDVAQAATGKNPGRTPTEWRTALAAGREGRYARRPSRTPAKPTIGELVPLDYVPNLALALSVQMSMSVLNRTVVDS